MKLRRLIGIYSCKKINFYALCGLHTYGNLSAISVGYFAFDENAKVLWMVGCCYNLLPEPKYDQSVFPMSKKIRSTNINLNKQAKMLACQNMSTEEKHFRDIRH